MVIRDFHFVCVPIAPLEADSPLIVYADAVHTRSITRQLLQPVARKDPEVGEILRGIDDQKLSQSRSLDFCRPARNSLPLEETTAVFVAEGLDHAE